MKDRNIDSFLFLVLANSYSSSGGAALELPKQLNNAKGMIQEWHLHYSHKKFAPLDRE